VDWVQENQVLLAGIVLVVLVVVGLALLAHRALMLQRTAEMAQKRVEPHLAAINAGLEDAERRVDAIASSQADLDAAMTRLEEKAGELRLLIDHAAQAMSVLRAPFRYLGR
jgi:hypothetical protein